MRTNLGGSESSAVPTETLPLLFSDKGARGQGLQPRRPLPKIEMMKTVALTLVGIDTFSPGSSQ